MIETFQVQNLLAGEDEYFVTVWLIYIHSMTTYFVVGGLFFLMDLTGKPVSLQKYKTQPDSNAPLDSKVFFKAFKKVLFNLTVVNVGVAHFFYILGKFIGFDQNLRETQNLYKMISDMLVMGVIYEIFFYYAHRLMHRREFYKRFHKVHHEWTAPVASMATHNHWFGMWLKK